MNSSDFFMGQLALRAYRDGGSEGLNGMRAVCFTFRNRIRAGWFGGSWGELLAHHKDYSYRIEPDEDSLPDPQKNHAFFLLLQEVDQIFDGRMADNVTVPQDFLPPPLSPQYVAPVSLYYGRLDQITSEKFLLEIARKPELHPRIASVGLLTFFG